MKNTFNDQTTLVLFGEITQTQHSVLEKSWIIYLFRAVYTFIGRQSQMCAVVSDDALDGSNCSRLGAHPTQIHRLPGNLLKLKAWFRYF